MSTLPEKNKKDASTLIEGIEQIREKNNANWMDILRLAYAGFPKETKAILKKIYACDQKISKIVKELTK